jgi:excisionase family DNA binding protein
METRKRRGATPDNHEEHTPTYHCTDQQALAAFRQRLAAFLLHGTARLLSVREVARVFAVSTPIVYRLCGRGDLAHIRIGNAIRIAPEALADYVANPC